MDCEGKLFTVICLAILYTVSSSSSGCHVFPECLCKLGNGSFIDLLPIAQTDGTPRFRNIETYSYNPCLDFDEDTCKSTAVCQHTNPATTLGSNKDAVFHANDTTNMMELIYQHNNTRGAIVTLNCTTGNDTLAIKDSEIINQVLYQRMVLSSQHACLKNAPKGLSAGSVLLIVFFVVCAIYFFGGMLVMRFIRGATGKEMIPHYDFWVDLPNLVLDGIFFVVRGCKADTAYDRI